jgi:trehalose transport system permease protein
VKHYALLGLAPLVLYLGVFTVAASTMRYVFGMVGYLNEVLYRLGILTLPIDETGPRWLAVVTVAMDDAWKVTPLVMLIRVCRVSRVRQPAYLSSQQYTLRRAWLA